MENEAIQLQFGEAANPGCPTLVYLPGLHGDCTLIGRFRRALAGRVRFVGLTYPRTLSWSLNDYADAIENILAAQEIQTAWLLGESFGSQPLWSLIRRRNFDCQGVILAGGFVKYPARWPVKFGERILGGVSLRWITRALFGYARLVRSWSAGSQEAVAEVREFVARRTELDRQAMIHRLRLLLDHDPRRQALELTLPLYALTGAVDPIVPWPWVRRWLRRNAPALREYKIVWPADHNVLSTAAQVAADSVVNWIGRPAPPPPASQLRTPT